MLVKENIAFRQKKVYWFSLCPGIYIVNLHTNTGRQSIKFVKKLVYYKLKFKFLDLLLTKQ
jgi:hypothetical protein